MLLTSFAVAAQAAPPGTVEIAYEVRRNDTTVADAVHRLEHDGRSYLLTESWRGRGIFALRGSARRTSRGVVVAEGLRPLEYLDERSGRDTARAAFDWSAKTVTLQYREGPRQVPLPARPHDRLAFLFDFSFVPPKKPEVVLDIADGRGISHQVYRVGPRETVRTPAGEFAAIRLTRTKEDERADIWLAVQRHYLPVRMVITGKDGVIEQVATRLTVQ
ncbi:MAG TPA: DUF3108 domain-containing protein [Burkholderiales bacterium]|nr:DUF3108 domain-containing protein [Burkholderiales bacterium]